MDLPSGPGPHPAVLLVGDGARAHAAALVDAGFAVAPIELPADGADATALASLGAAASELGARQEVDASRLAAVGAAAAALPVYLFACRGEELAAVALLGGPVLRAGLDEARPVQPLEMTLNLSAAVLGVFAEDDPAAPPADVALLREALSQGCKHFDIVTPPGTEDATGAAGRAALLAFLREWLEPEERSP